MLFTLVDRFAATGFTDMMTSAEHSKGAVLKVRNHTSTIIERANNKTILTIHEKWCDLSASDENRRAKLYGLFYLLLFRRLW